LREAQTWLRPVAALGYSWLKSLFWACISTLERKPIMRMLLKVDIPVEPGNAAAKSGKLSTIIQTILAELKPEAAYFSDDKGQRMGYLFLDLEDASQIPAICEPWMLAFNAAIELHPVMVPADLAKAAPAIKKAVKKYA
jgi:hypothetical protein